VSGALLGVALAAAASAAPAAEQPPGTAASETEDPWSASVPVDDGGEIEEPAYEVRQPDPWAAEPPRRPGSRRPDSYEHQDARDPWAATRGERRRMRGREIPEAVRPPQVAPAAIRKGSPVGYDEGFYLRTADDRFRLTINGRFEARYTYEDLDTAAGPAVSSAFSIPRARLALGGHLFGQALTFRLQTAVDRGFGSLKDAYADYAIVPGWLHFRGGQFKRPLSRQQITSSVNFQFLERAITSGRLGAARDIGLLVHDDYESSPTFEYAIGLFNGTGEHPRLAGSVIVDPITGEGAIVDGAFTNVPDRFHPELTARVAYNHGDIDGYSEVDFDGGPTRFSIGASGLVGFDGPEPSNPANLGTGNVLSHVDTILKAYGFTTTAGGFLLFVQDGADWLDQAYSSMGFHVQAGYLLFDRAQPAVRYARVHREQRGTVHEVGGALSIYFLRQHLAWRTDALVYLEDYAPAWRDHFVVRSQFQLGF
jgi:hypothetical protein